MLEVVLICSEYLYMNTLVYGKSTVKMICRIFWESIKTKCMTAQLLASKCSQTVESATDVGNPSTCTSVKVIYTPGCYPIPVSYGD